MQYFILCPVIDACKDNKPLADWFLCLLFFRFLDNVASVFSTPSLSSCVSLREGFVEDAASTVSSASLQWAEFACCFFDFCDFKRFDFSRFFFLLFCSCWTQIIEHSGQLTRYISMWLKTNCEQLMVICGCILVGFYFKFTIFTLYLQFNSTKYQLFLSFYALRRLSITISILQANYTVIGKLALPTSYNYVNGNWIWNYSTTRVLTTK